MSVEQMMRQLMRRYPGSAFLKYRAQSLPMVIVSLEYARSVVNQVLYI